MPTTGQIVGLIEIEVRQPDAQACPLESPADATLSELLTWLASPVGSQPGPVESAARSAGRAPHRLAATWLDSASSLVTHRFAADLGQLALELAGETARLQAQLA